MASPAISGKAATSIRQQIRRMRFHLRSDLSFAEIARWIKSRAGAWAAYYGRCCPSETVDVLFHPAVGRDRGLPGPVPPESLALLAGVTGAGRQSLRWAVEPVR